MTDFFCAIESVHSQSSNDSPKSPISTVHEKAFRHNLQAIFEVVEERGPPHMKTFITECRVGEQFRTVGEGNGKKVSSCKFEHLLKCFSW